MNKPNTTTEEKEKIVFLRDEFQPEGLSKHLNGDLSLLRWLRQNKLDVDIAAHRLRKHLVYRKLLRLDRDDVSTFEEDEHLRRTLPFCWLGTHDKRGSPVVVRLAGRTDIEGSLNTIKTSTYLYQEMMHCEKRMRYLTKKSEDLQRIVGICLILDLDGLKFDPRNITLMTSYFKPLEEFIVEQNFPGIEESILIINAPKLIASVYGLLRSFWPTMNVYIFDHDYQKNLLELIDADQLPEMFGGTLKEENFATPLVIPKQVPIDAYYNADMDPEKTFPMQIRARTKQRIELPEVPAKTRISWFFKGDHDIAFGLFRVSPDNSEAEDEMVVPKHRSKTDLVAESGEYVCLEDGKYALNFCNGHSRLMWKNISVAVTVTHPQGKEVNWTQREVSSYPSI